jgi:hypothetical protein
MANLASMYGVLKSRTMEGDRRAERASHPDMKDDTGAGASFHADA